MKTETTQPTSSTRAANRRSAQVRTARSQAKKAIKAGGREQSRQLAARLIANPHDELLRGMLVIEVLASCWGMTGRNGRGWQLLKRLQISERAQLSTLTERQRQRLVLLLLSHGGQR